MTTGRQREASAYPMGERARAFMRGIPNGEPMVSLARDGFEREGLPRERRIAYALEIAQSPTCGCVEIARMIFALSSGEEPPSMPETPYRSSASPNPIPDDTQEKLCSFFVERFRDAMDSIDRHIEGAQDGGSASMLSGAKIDSRIEKGLMAYRLLGCGAITSPQARTDLTRVFCRAARDVVVGGYIFTADSAGFQEAVIREFGGESIRRIIPHGISRYEAERILSVVSERLCGCDVSFLP
ncbi:MAG: hypothetical protein AB1324_03865 [Candidatus Micrarchaeota archaeon]